MGRKNKKFHRTESNPAATKREIRLAAIKEEKQDAAKEESATTSHNNNSRGDYQLAFGRYLYDKTAEMYKTDTESEKEDEQVIQISAPLYQKPRKDPIGNANISGKDKNKSEASKKSNKTKKEVPGLHVTTIRTVGDVVKSTFTHVLASDDQETNIVWDLDRLIMEDGGMATLEPVEVIDYLPPADASLESPQNFICPLCKRWFSNDLNMAVHIQLGHGKKYKMHGNVNKSA